MTRTGFLGHTIVTFVVPLSAIGRPGGVHVSATEPLRRNGEERKVNRGLHGLRPVGFMVTFAIGTFFSEV